MCLDAYGRQFSREILQHVWNCHALHRVWRETAAVPAYVTDFRFHQRQQRATARTDIGTRFIGAMQQSIEQDAGDTVAEQSITLHFTYTDATFTTTTFDRLIRECIDRARRTNLIG